MARHLPTRRGLPAPPASGHLIWAWVLPWLVPALPFEMIRALPELHFAGVVLGLAAFLHQVWTFHRYFASRDVRLDVRAVLGVDLFALVVGLTVREKIGTDDYLQLAAVLAALAALPVFAEALPTSDPQALPPEPAAPERPPIQFLPSRGAVAADAPSPTDPAPGAVKVLATTGERSPGDDATCPYCGVPIAAGEERMLCRSCRIPHHLDCWKAAARCTTYGCTSTRAKRWRPGKRSKRARKGRA